MVERFYIKGGTPLKGEVCIGGAKNSVLKLMAAAILAKGESKIYNVPDLTDVEIMLSVIAQLGAKTSYNKEEKSLTIDATDITNITASYELVSKMRASFIVLGALVSRCKEARVALPGGCAIGERRVDFHIRGLESLGAKIKIENGYVHAKTNKLVGADIYLDIPSVGATENIMLASMGAKGETVITNAAREPEIVDLAEFLKSCGAEIYGAGQSVIRIKPCKKMHSAEHTIIPDRIVASTFMACVASAGGKASVNGICREHLAPVIPVFETAGCEVSVKKSELIIKSPEKLSRVKSLGTMPYPGFPTDSQAIIMAVLTKAKGTSVISEKIFENRFRHVPELIKMGADIRVEDGRVAVIEGVEKLCAANVISSDLRGGCALVVAALGAEGKTVVDEIYHIDRGCEALETSLSYLGAEIKRE